jgi:drug/metabolite transporter (DMT)-like permease
VLCDSVIKHAGHSQLPNYEIVAFLGIFMASFIFIYAGCRGELKDVWPKRPTRLLVRGLLDVGNSLCVVVALRHLSLTLFYILVFTSPMLVAILGRLFLRELLDWRKVGAILIGFFGVVIAVYPYRSSGSSAWTGVAACAVCVSCFSAVIVWSRLIAQQESAESMTFFSGLVAAIIGLIAMLFHAAPITPGLLAVLGGMGLLGAAGSIWMFIALRSISAATVSQYHYSQLLSGAIVAYLFFQETPTVWMLSGAVLIVASGLYIAMREHGDGAEPSEG